MRLDEMEDDQMYVDLSKIKFGSTKFSFRCAFVVNTNTKTYRMLDSLPIIRPGSKDGGQPSTRVRTTQLRGLNLTRLPPSRSFDSARFDEDS
jgi:hypothetical protein